MLHRRSCGAFDGYEELVFLCLGDHDVHQDAQDQSTGDGGQGDLAEGNRQAADAADQNDSSNEQVLAGAQVHLLDHLQTGHSDEAVQGVHQLLDLALLLGH